MLSELVGLRGKNESQSIDAPEGQDEGHDTTHIVHAHNALSAAARLVAAVHAGDAHGVHLALADHHEAHRKMMGYDDEDR